MEDFIRQRLTVDRRTGLSITRLRDGRWQAQTNNPDGSATVMIAPDPADALWNALVPYTMHRRVASGRIMAAADAPPPALHDDLLGAIPAAVESDDVMALLG